MSEVFPQLCRCGNPTRDGRPTCGIVICLTNDAYERAMLVAARRTKDNAERANG